MSINKGTKPGPRHSSGKRAPMKNPVGKTFAAGLAITLGVSASAAGIAPVLAAPAYSTATTQYLSGSLLSSSPELVAATEATTVQGSADSSESVGGLLGFQDQGVVNLDVAEGVQVPLDLTASGNLGEYVSADSSGELSATVGLVNIDGTPTEVPNEAAPPGPVVIGLDSLISEEDAVDLASFTLGVLPVTSTATKAGTATVGVGESELSGVALSLRSPALANLDDSILASARAIDANLTAVSDPTAPILSQLALELGTTGVISDDSVVSLEVNTEPVVNELLTQNAVLGLNGPVVIDLSTGTVLVNLEELLEENGQSLNDLEPGTSVFSPEVLGLINAEVNSLVSGLLTDVTDTVATTVANSPLSVNLNVFPSETDNPGEGELYIFSFNVDGTLGEVASGTAAPEVVIGNEQHIQTVLSSWASTLVTSNVDTAALTEPVTSFGSRLNTIIPGIVTLETGIKETVDNSFTQTGLRLTLPGTTSAEGQALTLNFGTASVSHVASTDPVDPTVPVVIAFGPSTGPEAGANIITITGTNLSGVTGVLFGSTPSTGFTVVSDTEVRVTAPPGSGVVTLLLVTAENPEGVPAGQYTYIESEIPEGNNTGGNNNGEGENGNNVGGNGSGNGEGNNAGGNGTPTPSPTQATPTQPTTPSYANCDAVRAAGKAPIKATDPGFEKKFDRDNDGIGCEDGSNSLGIPDTQLEKTQNANVATVASDRTRLEDTGVNGTQMMMGAAALLLIAGMVASGISVARSRS